MNRKLTIMIFHFFIVLYFGCNISENFCAESLKIGIKQERSIFPYYYYQGATGQNQYIRFAEEENNRPIVFDETESNPDALEAFRKLNWRVILRNNNGKIHLIGKYNTQNCKLILDHWYLLPPFLVVYSENEGGFPPLFEKVKLKFDNRDFSGPIDDPELYNRNVFPSLDFILEKYRKDDCLTEAIAYDEECFTDNDCYMNQHGMSFVKIEVGTFKLEGIPVTLTREYYT